MPQSARICAIGWVKSQSGQCPNIHFFGWGFPNRYIQEHIGKSLWLIFLSISGRPKLGEQPFILPGSWPEIASSTIKRILGSFPQIHWNIMQMFQIRGCSIKKKYLDIQRNFTLYAKRLADQGGILLQLPHQQRTGRKLEKMLGETFSLLCFWLLFRELF